MSSSLIRLNEYIIYKAKIQEMEIIQRNHYSNRSLNTEQFQSSIDYGEVESMNPQHNPVLKVISEGKPLLN
jgi:hypothetical protein